MAVALVSATFTCSLPHPQRNCDFRIYSPRESWPGLFPLDLFRKPFILYPVVLIDSLEYLNHGAMRARLWLEAMPTLSMYEFASTELVQDYFGSVLARVMKAECCAESGYIYEACAILYSLVRSKHLPNPSMRDELAPESLQGDALIEADSLRFFNGVVLQDPRNIKAVGTLIRSGLPACIIDDALAIRLEPQERKYLRYRYALCVSRLLVRLGKMEDLLRVDPDAPTPEPVPKETGQKFFTEGGSWKVDDSVDPRSYLDEAESILLALRKEVVGVREDGSEYEPEDLSWTGSNPEGDEGYVRACLELCLIEEHRGNFDKASGLMERCLTLMEQAPPPLGPPIIEDSSVPYGPETDIGKARRHWRTQLDVQLWLDCRVRLCHIYFSQGKYAACEQQCTAGMREAADVNEKKLSREILLVHSQVMVLTGHPNEAIFLFESLIGQTREFREEDAVFAEALINYGDLRKEMGKLDHANALYEEAAGVVTDMIEAHGLDMTVLCQKPPREDTWKVRVLTVRGEDAPELDMEAKLEPGTTDTDTFAWERLENLYIPCMELFVEVSLRQAQCYAEKGRLTRALECLCLSRQVLLRTCNPLPSVVGNLNLLFGRVHTQLIWERGLFDTICWGKFDKVVAGPDADVETVEGFDLVQSFEFAKTCLEESLRVLSGSASHNRDSLRAALLELTRLHGMGCIRTEPPPLDTEADPAADPPAEHDPNAAILANAKLCAAWLEDAVKVTAMQESLFADTVALLDKPVIDGSDIPPAVTCGLQDAERFFGDSRVQPPEDGAPAQVGALSVLMYALTLFKEQPMSGLSHARRLERWLAMLHRNLKKMFPKYGETCCYTPKDAAEPPPELEAGTVRIQWCEYPFAESKDESPHDPDGSRPSSGASRVVAKARDDSIDEKDLPASMIYTLARPPPQEGDAGKADPKPVMGMVLASVERVEGLLRELREVSHLVDVDQRDGEGGELPEVTMVQIKQALGNVKAFFQIKEGEVSWHAEAPDPMLPDEADVVAWLPSLVAMFRRQLGVQVVDPALWGWLCACTAERDDTLKVAGESP